MLHHSGISCIDIEIIYGEICSQYSSFQVLNEKILEKPSDKDHAFEMLKR